MPDEKPTDGSVIGTAEPVARGRFFGEDGTWIAVHFPEGIELNLGPVMALGGLAAGSLGLFVLLTFLGKKYAPDEYEIVRLGVRDALGLHDTDDSETRTAVGGVLKSVFDPLGLVF